MAEHQIRFDDGAAYERMMGVWSRSVGEIFLDWVAPASGQRWIDVGCGSGAFTELLCARCAPAEIHGIDPSAGQLAFARTRMDASAASFQQGDATALPFAEDSFDAAAMALVIFFVPDPAKGVAEMARVVRPGGVVAAYVWDVFGGGNPNASVLAALRALGFDPPLPPSAGASRLDALHALWTGAGLEAVETRQIEVTRSFADFDDFWTITSTSGALASILATMASADIVRVKAIVRDRMTPDAAGRITYAGRANAVKGRVPK